MIFWYATSGHSDGGPFDGACFVEAQSANLAKMRAIFVCGVMPTQIQPLPRLRDEIPPEYLERRLSAFDLSEIDVILGGDGTGTIPADQREF
jgi:hypothetical protein